MKGREGCDQDEVKNRREERRQNEREERKGGNRLVMDVRKGKEGI